MLIMEVFVEISGYINKETWNDIWFFIQKSGSIAHTKTIALPTLFRFLFISLLLFVNWFSFVSAV